MRDRRPSYILRLNTPGQFKFGDTQRTLNALLTSECRNKIVNARRRDIRCGRKLVVFVKFARATRSWSALTWIKHQSFTLQRLKVYFIEQRTDIPSYIGDKKIKNYSTWVVRRMGMRSSRSWLGMRMIVEERFRS